MTTRGRRWLGALGVVLMLGGLGAGLYLTGNLPGTPAAGQAVADTTGGASGGSAPQGDGRDAVEVMPVPVELARVEGRGIAAYYRAASVVEADRLVELVAKRAGRVHVVNVEEGDWVEAGQVLAELENDRERIQLRKADLTVVDRKRQLDRSRSMLSEELISHQEFDDQESAFKMAQAERDLASISLEDTRIRAPFAGQLTERRVVPGQQLAVGASAFTLGDFSPLRVRVHLPEAIARKVFPQQRVLVAPESSDEALEAVVERIAPVVDPATSTVRLTLLLDDTRGAALVGGFVKVRITTDQHHDALAIPKLALVEERALRSVFVAAADTVRKVEIKTGLYDETHVEVLDGLFAGDYVVTMGQGGLRTGTVIKALNGEEVAYRTAREPGEGEPAAVTTALAGSK